MAPIGKGRWECMNCGRNNSTEDDTEVCGGCGMDKEAAMIMIVQKKKRKCEECGHLHRENEYCAVFCEAAEDDDLGDDTLEETESESGDEEDSDEEEESDDEPSKAETVEIKRVPLTTPSYAKAIRFIRCNCREGVPHESKRFEVVPRVVMCGPLIRIQTYAEIMDSTTKKEFEMLMTDKYRASKAMIQRNWEKKQTDFASLLPMILEYLPFGECNKAPMVSTFWNQGTNLYQEYLDVRGFVPWQVYRPHEGIVDSIMLSKNGKVYTGGDRRVLCSQLETGETLSLVTRDSGALPVLFEKDGELFCCSSNGSIRTYYQTESGKKMPMNKTMWDHTRAITCLMSALPSRGICAMHGIENHVCTIFTSSEDRTVKMYNLSQYLAVRGIYSNKLKRATFLSMSQSERHLFVGTSQATIAVFSKYPVCEREDVHACNIPGRDKSFCMQVTLHLPPVFMDSGAPSSVYGVMCTGFNHSFTHLWAGDSTGQLTIWKVPNEGIFFEPAYTIKAHSQSINKLVSTYKHCITISDDGFVLLFDLVTFAKIRSVNIVEWGLYKGLITPDQMYAPHDDENKKEQGDEPKEKDGRELSEAQIKTRNKAAQAGKGGVGLVSSVDRKLKSCYLVEDRESGGTLLVGTSYGEVVALSLGTTV